MSLNFADRVLETSTTTGTGTINLAGPVSGFIGFVAGVGNNKKVPYIIDDGTDWEVGIGTVTDASPDTLSRTTVHASSNANALVNWGVGTRNVRLGPTAKVMVHRDENMVYTEGLATSGGTGNAQTLTLDPAPAGYEDGMLFVWHSAGNVTGTATLNANTLGNKTLKWKGGDLKTGAYATGDLLVGRYNATSGFVDMLVPPKNSGRRLVNVVPYNASGNYTRSSATVTEIDAWLYGSSGGSGGGGGSGNGTDGTDAADSTFIGTGVNLLAGGGKKGYGSGSSPGGANGAHGTASNGDLNITGGGMAGVSGGLPTSDNEPGSASGAGGLCIKRGIAVTDSAIAIVIGAAGTKGAKGTGAQDGSDGVKGYLVVYEYEVD